MPRLCAFGCVPTGIVHRFPSYAKFPERFKEWVNLYGGKLETEANYVYYSKKIVCDQHFAEHDKNRNKRLNALAVPSLFIPGTPDTLSSEEVADNLNKKYQILSTHNLATGVAATTNLNVSVTSLGEISNILQEHNYSTIYSTVKQDKKSPPKKRHMGFNCVQISKMRSQLKRLRSEVCQLKKKGKFKSRFLNAKKLSESVAFQQTVQRLSKPSQLFLGMQLKATKLAKGRRFSIDEKILSLSLYKKSPKCYALLKKLFTLPSIKSMKRLISQIKITDGINQIVFEKLKKTIAELDKNEKLCSLMFDEMSLSPQVNYNSQKDKLEGFASNDKTKFADHVLVFMIKGVKKNFKQPLAYYFTSSLNKLELKKLIKSVIHHAQASGLIIINTVCDQSTVNVSAINELISETKTTYLRRGGEWRFDFLKVNNCKIIPLFDTPHLIKGIRNNLLSKDMIYCTKNKEKIVKWEYYQKVYAADKVLGELKLLHEITEEHINPEKINKMRVKTATQIFSHSVAVVTEHLTARGDLPEECKQIIDITVLLNNLFDSLNVSSFNIPDGKIFKGAVTKNSPHHKLWSESKGVLKSIKFLQKKGTGNKIRLIETTVPSVTNFIRTIEGIEAIWQILSRKYGFDAMLTRNFNQDPIENFFGNIRSYGARNNTPNTIAFEGAFKALLLNNFNSPHSRGANCEEDGNKCLQNYDFFLKQGSSCAIPSTPDTSDFPEKIIIPEELFEEVATQEDAGQKNYVCGWVLTKCFKMICKSCQYCRQNLINLDQNSKNQYIKAKEYSNKTWLCYPNYEAETCFNEIQNTVISYLAKNNHNKVNVIK